ncbi:MAG: ABC transporter ATP-binding protein [Chloroflexi bacterium]|nr:ABC transporter ATP-binding protein [Chloroflexota bacterium]
MSTAPAIHIENLSKTFGRGRKRVEAVRNLSLDVHSGQVYGFLGPNGAGKTTTIRMLLDLIRPTQGSAYVYGQHVRREHQVLRRVGALVEGATFYGFLSARRNLEVFARTGDRYDPRRINALLEQVGLAGRAEQRVKGYSTGMKQRLGLAAALLHDPDLLILDEPTNGLDPEGMHEIRLFIRRLADEQGKTIFLSSHLLGEIEQVCDRVAIINMGEIVREGAVATLLEGQAHLRVEAMPLERAAEVLRAQWPISTNGTWLTVQARREEIPQVVRRLVEQGVDVYQVATQRQTLEEYFLTVVQEAVRHD